MALTSYNVTPAEVSLIMGQLSPTERTTVGLSYVSTSSTAGVLEVPDSVLSAVDAAMQSQAMSAQQIIALKAYAANTRYNMETAGITVSGAPIATDRTSQMMIANAVALLSANSSLTSINFKQNNGSWQSIDRQSMLAIGVAVGTYVQACFTNEMTISDSIDAGQTTTASQIDQNTSWPSQTC